MPFVKIPGTDREVFVELHDPKEEGLPLLIAAGTEVKLTPERIAYEMADPNSKWDFSLAHEAAVKLTPEVAFALKASVNKFEPLRRKARANKLGVGVGGRGRGGRPISTRFSVAEDISVIATHFMLQGMKRQKAINQAVDYWINNDKTRIEPSRRLIDAALARIRRGGTSNLSGLVEFVRAKYLLPALPALQAVPPDKSKPKTRIK